MICLEGSGALSHFSLWNKPQVFNEPFLFPAFCVTGGAEGVPQNTRVLEGPVPKWKLFGNPGTGNGAQGTTFGFPRFQKAVFHWNFPFAEVTLTDTNMPVEVRVTGWSPFIPGNPDDSGLPAAGLEYTFRNRTPVPVEGIFSWNAKNCMAREEGEQKVERSGGGFIFSQGKVDGDASAQGAFSAFLPEGASAVNCAWFRGGRFDAATMAWKEASSGRPVERAPHNDGYGPSPGAALYRQISMKPGEEKTVRLLLTWYVPCSNEHFGPPVVNKNAAAGCCDGTRYSPWYAGRFENVRQTADYWADNYNRLRRESAAFSECLYDTDLPVSVIEAVSANLSILKSPTVLRQRDGRLWAWEGCRDDSGCCAGSCTHVWNYAQAVSHLFPSLERTLRETEFGPSQNEEGHQVFRSALPIGPGEHRSHAAADGQLGGIMKIYREWLISGDREWLREIWPQVEKSINYCIETWDPRRRGLPEEPHHNTYDIEFWGPDGMCGSFYLGALKAAGEMAAALGEEAAPYNRLFADGKRYLEEELFNGEYFYQKITTDGLKARNPRNFTTLAGDTYSPEALELLKREGPKYQYGEGCLSDGILGDWMARVCGLGPVLDREKVRENLRAIFRYNYRPSLRHHVNPQRPGYAAGEEGGLLLCSWPRSAPLSLPFPYSDEVWTGIEYQAASHLIMEGFIEEGETIVKSARARYDGRVRNPFNEYECGHWYARALSSYALLQAYSGARYDKREKLLSLSPAVKGDFRCFFAAEEGWGTVGVADGKPFFTPVAGNVEVREIRFREEV